MSDQTSTTEKTQVPRLGLAGAGLPAVDPRKAEEGVRCTIPMGRLKGIEMVVRLQSLESSHQSRFLEQWAAGEFRKALKERSNGDGPAAGPVQVDEEKLGRSAIAAFRTPEYAAHVLIADLPQPIEIPDHVDDLADMPLSTHDHYMPDESGEGFRRKKNRSATVDYSPDVGVWLLRRYPELDTWVRTFARREESFLEERTEIEGNA